MRIRDFCRTITVFYLSFVFMGAAVSAEERLECKVGFPERWGKWTRIEGDQVKGPLVEALEAIFAQLPADMVALPRMSWRDVLDGFAAGEVDVLGTAIRYPAREQSMHFAGPLLHYYWAAFEVVGREALPGKQRRVAVNRVMARIEPIPTIVARLNAEIVPAPGAELMAMLADDQVDMVLGARSIAVNEAKERGLDVREVVGSAVRSEVYLGVSKVTACASIAPHLNAAIRSWRQQGGEKRLLEAAAFSPQ